MTKAKKGPVTTPMTEGGSSEKAGNAESRIGGSRPCKSVT
jgi:hypothetical protein